MSFEEDYTRHMLTLLISNDGRLNNLTHGLFKINDLEIFNLKNQLIAAERNRYSSQRKRPAPTNYYSTPYVFCSFFGYGLELIQMNEYEPELCVQTIEHMLSNGELIYGRTVDTPLPHAETTMTAIKFNESNKPNQPPP